MKKNIKFLLRSTLVLYIFLALGYVIVLHVIHHTPQLIDNKYLVDCKKSGKLHTVTVTNDRFTPSKIIANTCDRIVFTNKDSVYHQVAFGDHDDHLIYPGFSEKAIKPNSNNTAILKAFGTYKIHDHFYEHLEGEIIIKQ